MEICVFGAGSIGGFLATHLKLTGLHNVSVVGRGPHLAAIRERGLELVMPSQIHHVQFDAAEDQAAKLPPQDIVFVTLKSHSIPNAAADIRRLLKPDGFAVFVVNGIPWWWNLGRGAAASEATRVDPARMVERELGIERAFGCVVYSANEVTAPGKVVHLHNNRWILGEAGGQLSDRLRETGELMNTAGLNAEITDDLRGFIWKKLLRNTVFNTLCGSTRLIADEFLKVPPLLELAQQLTDEVIAVAGASGWNLPQSTALSVIRPDPSEQLGGADKKHGKASMHQDVLAGRRLEVEAVIGEVQHIARHQGVTTPAIDAVYAILRGIDHGLSLGALVSGRDCPVLNEENSA